MRVFAIAALWIAFAGVAAPTEVKLGAEEIWTKTLAAYAGLSSYADAGVVVTEYGAAGAHLRETHKFKTVLNRPRQFYFEFNEDPAAGAERLVIWCDGGAEFNSWWSTTGVHEVYPQGQGVNAFAMGSLPSKGSAVLVPALIFAQAGLQGALLSLEELKLEGSEKLDGRETYKLSAIAREKYGNEYVSSERPTSVWVDAQSFMIAKIRQDTPLNSGGGVVDRVTTVLKPMPNAAPAAGAFTFAVPKVQP